MYYRIIIASVLAFSLLTDIVRPVAISLEDNRKTNMLPNRPKQNTKPESGKLSKPPDPEATALFIHLLDRYINNAPDKTRLDDGFAKTLNANSKNRQAASLIVKNFQNIPLSVRKDIYGIWADISTTAKIPESKFQEAFSRLVKSNSNVQPAPNKDADGNCKGPVRQDSKKSDSDKRKKNNEKNNPKPEYRNKTNFQHSLLRQKDIFPTPLSLNKNSFSLTSTSQQQRFQLFYEGLWCHSETDEDHGTPSDEIYIITTVSETTGAATTQTHPNPYRKEYYEDLDDGDKRVGPRRLAWGGDTGSTARELFLTVLVYEQDSGDPDDIAQAMDLIWNATEFVCAVSQGSGQLPCLIAIGAALLINLAVAVFTGGGDDLVSTQVLRITADQLREWEQSETRFRGDIPYHFSTVHNAERNSNAEGADYHVYFRVITPRGIE